MLQVAQGPYPVGESMCDSSILVNASHLMAADQSLDYNPVSVFLYIKGNWGSTFLTCFCLTILMSSSRSCVSPCTCSISPYDNTDVCFSSLQMHPLGLCNNNDDEDLYEYGWVGVVKLEQPELDPSCLTVLGKVNKLFLKRATH